MSPILVRPVREQLEHDRVIRLLQLKYRRKFNVGLNPGSEQSAPAGEPPLFPDLVLTAQGRGRRTLGIVEVETSESVNNLEAMAQWVPFSRLSAPFILYVPVTSVDAARRLCGDLSVPVAEIWTYHTLGDQLRFTQVYHAAETRGSARTAPSSARPKVRAAAPRKAARSKPARGKAPASRRGAAKTARAVRKPASKRK